MVIRDYMDRYRVKVSDIKDNFELEKRFDVSMQRGDCCENCGGVRENINIYPSEPWVGVKTCGMCDRILVTHYQDAMGGIRIDIIEVYKEK